jgi:ribokinase
VKEFDLIGCGALNLDLIYRLPDTFALWNELPPAGSEQALSEPLRQTIDDAVAYLEPRQSGGGQAANATFALGRMGFSVAMLGRLGKDAAGEFIIRELGAVDTRFLARDGVSGRVYILLDEHGERRNFVWPGANDEFDVKDLPRHLPPTRYAYFSSFLGEKPLATQLTLLERLAPEVEVAFDPGEIYARRGVKWLIPFLKRASFVFATEKELGLLCGLPADEATEFLLKAGAGLVVRKMGARGARIVGRRLDLYVPPHPAEVVDVTGAGDLFAAGFIGGLLEGLGLEAAGHLAAWAASKGIAGVGRSTYPGEELWRARVEDERALNGVGR